MKIQFKKETWVIKRTCGGFQGGSRHQATLIRKETPFEVKRIDPCGKRISDIYVYNDGRADGYSLYLINVPNELYEVLDEN